MQVVKETGIELCIHNMSTLDEYLYAENLAMMAWYELIKDNNQYPVLAIVDDSRRIGKTSKSWLGELPDLEELKEAINEQCPRTMS